MKMESKNKKKKKEELIKSCLILKKQIFELIEKIYIIIRITIKRYLNKKSKKDKYQEDKIRKIEFVKKDLLFCDTLILLMISASFFGVSLNLIINGDSIITLKVSQNGDQKIFNGIEKPTEILIDNSSQPIIENYIYSLNKTNIVTLIWTDLINNCRGLFKDCNTIIEINFTDFDATNCLNLDYMFRDCSSLKSLDLTGLKTSNLLNSMSNIFWGCKSLISLNLSTFDTSEVTNFGHLFSDCKLLEWIDISNFKTEKVNYIDNMFNGCKKLTSVNLSHFNTSQVLSMDYMFSGCESLKIIDFSNLDVTSVTNINVNGVPDNVFFNCTHLEYIDIKNLNSNIILDNKFLKGTPINLTVCNKNDKIELSKIKLTNNSDCRLNRCYNNYSDYKIKKNTQGYDNNFGIEYLFDDLCNINYEDESKEGNLIFDDILEKIEYIFTSKEYDTPEIENGKNDIYKYKNMLITLTSTKNQKNYENIGNSTTID